MSDKKDDIKELFQKELGNYQAKVNPNLWNGIQAGIGGASAATGAGSALGLTGKIIIGAVVATTITVGTIFYVNTDKETPKQEENTPVRVTDSIQEEKLNEELIDNTSSQEKAPVDNVSSEQEVQDYNEDVVLKKEASESKNKNELSFVDPSSESIENNNENTSSTTAKNQQTSKENTNQKPVVDQEKLIPSSSTKEERKKEKETVDLSEISAQIVEQNNQYVKFNVDGFPENSYIVWEFGDGSIDRSFNPEHFYAEAGIYEVKCIVNSDDQEVTETIQVEINVEGKIDDLPNVFTPNGDGRNDEFFIQCKNIKNFQLTIIDQQQNVVYSTNDVDFRWTGVDKTGKEADEGIYYYIIVAEDESGNTINKYQQLRLKR